MSNSSLVTRLEGKLHEQSKSRQIQDELNSKLQTEYDQLLKRLAEAENHIDRLRLGANLELNRHFVVTHEHRYGDTTSGVGPMVPPHTSHIPHTATHTSTSVGTNWDEEEENTSLLIDLDENVTHNPSYEHLPQYRLDVGTDAELEPFDHSPSAHPLYEDTPSFSADEDLSVTTIVDRASAESQQYAHLTKIKSLQAKISELQSKLNEGGSPFNEMLGALQEVQREHRQLSADIGQSQEQLEALKKKCDGRVSQRLTSSQQALGNELTTLADQLTDFVRLLQSKAESSSGSTSPTPSHAAPTPLHKMTDSEWVHGTSATESALHAQMSTEWPRPHEADSPDSIVGSELSCDSSPFLSSKYFPSARDGGSHDQPEKSHDHHHQSHDYFEKPRDLYNQSHDQFSESHDTFAKSHDTGFSPLESLSHKTVSPISSGENYWPLTEHQESALSTLHRHPDEDTHIIHKSATSQEADLRGSVPNTHDGQLASTVPSYTEALTKTSDHSGSDLQLPVSLPSARHVTETLPTGRLHHHTGIVSTASLPTASLPTALLPTSLVPTGLVFTDLVSTASLPTGLVSTGLVSTASLPTASLSTGLVSTGLASVPASHATGLASVPKTLSQFLPNRSQKASSNHPHTSLVSSANQPFPLYTPSHPHASQPPTLTPSHSDYNRRRSDHSVPMTTTYPTKSPSVRRDKDRESREMSNGTGSLIEEKPDFSTLTVSAIDNLRKELNQLKEQIRASQEPHIYHAYTSGTCDSEQASQDRQAHHTHTSGTCDSERASQDPHAHHTCTSGTCDSERASQDPHAHHTHTAWTCDSERASQDPHPHMIYASSTLPSHTSLTPSPSPSRRSVRTEKITTVELSSPEHSSLPSQLATPTRTASNLTTPQTTPLHKSSDQTQQDDALRYKAYNHHHETPRASLLTNDGPFEAMSTPQFSDYPTPFRPNDSLSSDPRFGSSSKSFERSHDSGHSNIRTVHHKPKPKHSIKHSHYRDDRSKEDSSKQFAQRPSIDDGSTSKNISGSLRSSRGSSFERPTRSSVEMEEWSCGQCGGRGTSSLSVSPGGTRTHTRSHKCTQLYRDNEGSATPLKYGQKQVAPLRLDHPSSVTRDRPSSITSNRPSSVTRDRPSYITRDRPSSVTRDVPPPITRDRPSSVTRDVPPSVTRDCPSSITRDRPSSVTRDVPPSVTRDCPPSITRDRPSSVTRDVPPSVTRDRPSSVCSNPSSEHLVNTTASSSSAREEPSFARVITSTPTKSQRTLQLTPHQEATSSQKHLHHHNTSSTPHREKERSHGRRIRVVKSPSPDFPSSYESMEASATARISSRGMQTHKPSLYPLSYEGTIDATPTHQHSHVTRTPLNTGSYQNEVTSHALHRGSYHSATQTSPAHPRGSATLPPQTGYTHHSAIQTSSSHLRGSATPPPQTRYAHNSATQTSSSHLRGSATPPPQTRYAHHSATQTSPAHPRGSATPSPQTSYAHHSATQTSPAHPRGSATLPSRTSYAHHSATQTSPAHPRASYNSICVKHRTPGPPTVETPSRRERVVYTATHSPPSDEEVYVSEGTGTGRRKVKGRRKVIVRPVHYVVRGKRDQDNLKVCDGVDLAEARLLARTLKRRSREMHDSLKELAKLHNF